MKNILIIAYYYPPLGGAGVQRTLKFSKYLNEIGYNVSVLTVDCNDNIIVKDTTLINDVKPEVKVYRAKDKKNFVHKLKEKFFSYRNSNTLSNINSTKTGKSSYKGRTLTTGLKKYLKNTVLQLYNYMFIPDDKIGWKKSAVQLGKKIIIEDGIDVIYSTSGPYTSHLIAYELKKTFNIPWISDFRDPWYNNPFVKLPYLLDKINYNLEKKVIKNADYIISVSLPIINDFTKVYKQQQFSKFKVITNGYDEEDFIDYNPRKNKDKFTMLYNGTLYGKRSPTKFLVAIDELIKSNKLNKESICIKFVGKIGNQARYDLNEFSSKYDDVIKCIDYLPHKESLKQVEEASALLLIIEGGKGSEGIYTGKIFEYIRSKKNIIGIVPDGVARELIKQTNTGFCCYPDNVQEIKKAIFKCYNIWNNKESELPINWDKVQSYNRYNLTKKLSEIIEKC